MALHCNRRDSSLQRWAQRKLLHIAGELTREYLSTALNPLALQEADDLRGQLAAWEQDWNAPGMQAHDWDQTHQVGRGY